MAIDFDRLMELVEESMFGASDMGMCVNCGNEQPAEPDARKYECDDCGKFTVYGAEELLLMV